MAVRFFYVDESHDDTLFCLSAIAIRHRDWKDSFERIRAFRAKLKSDHGVYLRKEIHARDLVAGRGKIADKEIGKWQRSRIFYDLLALTASLPGVLVFNICLEKKGRRDPQLDAWDRLVNRIERTMKHHDDTEAKIRDQLLVSIKDKVSPSEFDEFSRRLLAFRSRSFIVSDEGRELEITRVLRKMGVYNPIPSQYGVWSSGASTKNIRTERIIEDPYFKPSHRSYFIQLADCVAFALLKKEARATPNISKYRINLMFEEAIGPACFRRASPREPLGIVRK